MALWGADRDDGAGTELHLTSLYSRMINGWKCKKSRKSWDPYLLWKRQEKWMSKLLAFWWRNEWWISRMLQFRPLIQSNSKLNFQFPQSWGHRIYKETSSIDQLRRLWITGLIDLRDSAVSSLLAHWRTARPVIGLVQDCRGMLTSQMMSTEWWWYYETNTCIEGSLSRSNTHW